MLDLRRVDVCPVGHTIEFARPSMRTYKNHIERSRHALNSWLTRNRTSKVALEDSTASLLEPLHPTLIQGPADW
jgi:hypothetical protein